MRIATTIGIIIPALDVLGIYSWNTDYSIIWSSLMAFRWPPKLHTYRIELMFSPAAATLERAYLYVSHRTQHNRPRYHSLASQKTTRWLPGSKQGQETVHICPTLHHILGPFWVLHLSERTPSCVFDSHAAHLRKYRKLKAGRGGEHCWMIYLEGISSS